MADEEYKTGNIHVDRALNELDAAMFNGDTFIDRHAIDVMRRYVCRWQLRLEEHEEMLVEHNKMANGDEQDD